MEVGGVTHLSVLSLINFQFDHVYMIGGVTHRGLPPLFGVPHLHVNRPLETSLTTTHKMFSEHCMKI